MRQGVAKFAPLVNRTRSFRSNVAGNATRERKLGEQPFHSSLVLRDVRINLGVSALQIRVGYQARPAMSWPGDINNAQVSLVDNTIEVDIDEIQPWSGPPM